MVRRRLFDDGWHITAKVLRLLPTESWVDIPDGLVFTTVYSDDPIIWLVLEG